MRYHLKWGLVGECHITKVTLWSDSQAVGSNGMEISRWCPARLLW